MNMMNAEAITAKEIKIAFSSSLKFLNKIPLSDRLEIDCMMANALGHDPKIILRKGAICLFEAKVVRFWRSGMAAKIAKEYDLTADEMRNGALKAYGGMTADGYYSHALEYALKFGLGDERLKAVKGLMEFLKDR